MKGMGSGTDGIIPGINGVDHKNSAARHVAGLHARESVGIPSFIPRLKLLARDFYNGLFTFGQKRKFRIVAFPDPHAYMAGRTPRNPPSTLCCIPEISTEASVFCQGWLGSW